MRVRFLGTGDAFGAGGRFNTSLLLESDGHRALVDCGATALVAMRAQGIDPATVTLILVSHLHGDHFGGLPFLLLEARYGARRAHPLTIAGPPDLEQRVTATLELLYAGTSATVREHVPYTFVELASGTSADIDGWGIATVGVEHGLHPQACGLRISRDGRLVAFSGDTGWTDALVPLARGADLFVCECTSWDRDVPSHLSHTRLIAERERLEARRIILTHLGPDMLARLDEAEYECAHDGLVVEV